MLKSLKELPKGIQDVVLEFTQLPTFVKLLDRMTIEDGNAYGRLYAVMKTGTVVAEDPYKSLEIQAIECAKKEGWEVWDTTDVIMSTWESDPMWLEDIDSYEEGVIYRTLTKDKVREELGHAIS